MVETEVIRSSDNRIVKWMRSLRQRHVREAERAFIVEGVRAVEDALEAGGRPHLLLFREGFDWLAPQAGYPVRLADARVFDRLAETESPQPLLAAFEFPELEVDSDGYPLYLVVDNVRDPGNLGTLLRSAAASGATAVLFSEGTVDPYNGKVVRAAMGAHFRVPIQPLDGNWAARLLEIRCRVLAESDALLTYDEINWRQPAVVIIGSEASGATGAGRSLATTSASIPSARGVESLNAGVAGAVILFEAARQRRIS